MWVRSHILKSDNAMDFSQFMPLSFVQILNNM